MGSNDNCKNCYFYCSTTGTCDYWLIADQLRGCPPGKGCTKKNDKEGVFADE